MYTSKMSEYQAGGGIYNPIGVLFETPIYEWALMICWHSGSYKDQIAIMAEMLRLRQRHQLPSTVSVKDMCDLMAEKSKKSRRMQLWKCAIEDMDEEAMPLLHLVWEVINSLKMRDIAFEARMILHSGAVPPNSNYPKITRKAQKYAKTLTEQLQKPPSFRLLGPREVVLEVVPKVLQGLWLPPPDTFLNMPSQQLSTMAVAVTKAVLDQVSAALSTMEHRSHFFHAMIDVVILTVLKKIKLNYSPAVLTELLEGFAVPLLQNIIDTTAEEICELFEPRPVQDIAEDMDGEETSPCEDEDDVSPVITPPPAPLTLAAQPSGESLVTTPPPPVTPTDKPAAQEELTIKVQTVKVDEMVKTKKESRGFRRCFGWLQKNYCCCFWPGVTKEA